MSARSLYILTLVLALGSLVSPVWAQPANDNCVNATAVPLGAGNYGLGVYTTATTNLTGATTQLGEYFDPVLVTAGNDKKTVWYKFTIPVHRGVRIELKQNAGNTIPQADAGFVLFYAGTGACLPGATAIQQAKLTPLGKFGNSFNPCLEPGDYLLQVAAKNNAQTEDPVNSNIWLDITISYPSVSNNHDLHTAPYNFGTVSTTSDWNWYDYEVGCLTREQTEAPCAALGGAAANYTQSSWHTFTTDNFVDFVRFQLRQTNMLIPPTPNPWQVAFVLYQGDATASATPWSSLSQVGSCQLLTPSSNTVDLSCQLLPNTTYSIQLFFHKDNKATAGVRIYELGIGTTESPLDNAAPFMSGAHKMGTLAGSPGGTWYTRADEWACNAAMSLNPCGTVKPAAGYTVGGVTYNLNDWVTFTLSGYANVTLTSYSNCMDLYNRLYTGDVDNNCNIGLYSGTAFNTNNGTNQSIFCLPAGTYSWQVMGRSGTLNDNSCWTSHIGQPLTISINVATVDQNNRYDWAAVGRVDTVNRVAGVHQPLPDGVTVNAANDRMGCNNTILPADFCAGSTKATYRIINIGDSDGDGVADNGLLTVGGLNFNFQYKLYAGDVRTKANGTSPTTFNNTGFVDQLGCFNTQQTLCVSPGIYTLVSYGDATDVGRSDQPWFRFQKYETRFNLRTASRVDRINYGGGTYFALNSGTSYTSTLDYFDCTPTVLPSTGVCAANQVKAIYRTFRIGANGLMTITGTCGNRYRLYRGDASALANAQGLFDPNAVGGETITGLTAEGSCFDGWCWWYGCYNYCTYSCLPTFCVEPGLYTLVSFKDNSVGNVGVSDQPVIRFDAKDNIFDLANAAAFNNINGGAPLTLGSSYTTTRNHFDCYQTVLPAGDVCGAHDRAQYRIFTLNTSGIIRITGTSDCFQYRVYSGNASTLATSFTYPNTIAGLTQVGNCFSSGGFSQCMSPGTYTLVTFGDANDRGLEDQPTIQFVASTTLFDDPTAGRVNHMGNMTSGGTGTVDVFSCLENPRTIDGQAPCGGATKLIYREFEITTATRMSISTTAGTVGTHSVFTGWASDPGGWANLAVFNQPDTDPDGSPHYNPVSWSCFTSRTTETCVFFPPGKYTIVSYGTVANLGQQNNVTFSIPGGPTAPKYNRPFKAYNAGTTDYNMAADGVAYPNTKKEYVFGTDYFDCTKDLPNAYLDACTTPGVTFNRTSYYVFTITQESYIRINNIPNSHRMRVYPFDVRVDSLRMNPMGGTYIPPVQNCLYRQDHQMCDFWVEEGELELCRLQPGTYTLLLFATNNHIWSSVTPRMWVEKVENSRFDHARLAYDFGTVPGDNTERRGKVGATNPLHAGRAASNDFFSCKTSAQWTDPTYGGYQIGGYRINGQPSVPVPMPTNHALYEIWPGAQDTTKPLVRRNLWYTFVMSGAGTIEVGVYNMAPTASAPQSPWAIYESNVDGSLPFSALQSGVAPANVDSTLALGLTLIAQSGGPYCNNYQKRSFFRDPCSAGPRRYYVVVDHAMAHELNNQIEVSVRYDSIATTGVKYDTYPTANRINGLGQTDPPYTNVVLNNGKYFGAPSDFFCYTTNAYDQRTCAGVRTIWYRVDISTLGRIRLNYSQGVGDTTFNGNVMQLFYDATPGNPNGLVRVSLASVVANSRNWGEACISPGTYYIMMTDCGLTTQTIRPQVWLMDHDVPYDKYWQTNRINGLNQKNPPYTSVDLTNGVYVGDTATFACATRDAWDQDPACGTKTLWYAFDVASTGYAKVNFDVLTYFGVAGGGTTFNTNSMELYREVVPGDSTATGLVKVPLTDVWAVNPVSGVNSPWGQACYYAGRYYLKLTGCWYTTQQVVPRIWLDEHRGDFCTRPANLTVGNNQTQSTSVNVNCHTIGESFGESGSDICALNLAGTKSSWFEIDLNVTQKVDLTFRLTESTTAFPEQIRYRVNLGRCDAMTAAECNYNAATEFTLNCMEAGTYFVQVIMPENATGTVQLQVSNVVRVDQNCIPPSPVVANFTVASGCEDTPIQFTNQSTLGDAMKYYWNFGDGSPIDSSSVNPLHDYPDTGIPTNYTVTLIARDTVSGAADTVTANVTTYPRPGGFISRVPGGATVTAGTPIDFNSNATNTIALPATTYYWTFGDGNTSTLANPTGITINKLGTNIVNLTITNGTCTITDADTFVLGTEPIYRGGPNDGTGPGERMITCNTMLWPGGPNDGADPGELAAVCPEMLWPGGPNDGADPGELAATCPEMLWPGGPNDGADPGELASPCIEMLWPGGPFDGTDPGEYNATMTNNSSGSDSICAGQSIVLTASTPMGGTYTYAWSTGATTNSISVSPTVNTNYTLTMTPTAAPPGGCSSNIQEDFFVFVFPTPTANAGNNLSWCGTSTGQLGTAAVTGYTYSWAPATYLSSTTVAQPTVSPPPGVNVTYTVTVTGPGGGSCGSATDDVNVTTYPEPVVASIPDSTICPGDNLDLTASGADRYVWSRIDGGFTSSDMANPLAAAAYAASTNNGTANQARTGTAGYWARAGGDADPWLRVDLGSVRIVTDIATGGTNANFVNTFRLSYSDDNLTYKFYTVNGVTSTFTAATFNLTEQNIAYFFRARYVRFHPVTVTGTPNMDVQVITATQPTANNPYNVSTPGTYVVYAQGTNCPGFYTDTVRVSYEADQPLHYRSDQNGNWTALTTWEVWDPTAEAYDPNNPAHATSPNWLKAESLTCPPISYPTSRSLTVQVRDSVVYNTTIAIGIDQVTIDPKTVHNATYGGVLHIPLGITCYMVDSSATPIPADIQNNGRINIEGDFTPVGAGLLVNSDASTVAYIRNGNQTMWNGQYGRLEADGSGIKTVGGTSTLVRTETAFMGAYIQLNNRNITLDTNAVITGAGCVNGYFVTNGLGQVFKRNLGAGGTTSFEMPVGHSTASFNRALFANTGTADTYGFRVTGNFDFEAFSAIDALRDSSSVDRTWYITENTNGGSNYSLTLYWLTAHENYAFNRNYSTLGYFNPVTGWERMTSPSPALGGGVCANEYTQVKTAITTTGSFSVGSCASSGLDYRTIANGKWTNLAIWEVYDKLTATWYPANGSFDNCGAVNFPTSLSRTVTVRHKVEYDSSIVIGVDQVSIETTGHLWVPETKTLLLDTSGLGSDFQVSSNGSNGIDLHNKGRFEITGYFLMKNSGGVGLLVNTDASVVNYNGTDQNMWNGSYGHLWVDDSSSVRRTNAATLKTLTGINTEVRTGLWFRNAKIQLGNYDCRLLDNCVVTTPGQNTGYMIATSYGYCRWEYGGGAGESHLFPIGGVYYSPAQIVFDNVTTPGFLKGRVRELQHPLAPNPIFRYWTMDTVGSTIRYVSGTNSAGYWGYSGLFHYVHEDLQEPWTSNAQEYLLVEEGRAYSIRYTEVDKWRRSLRQEVPYLPNADLNVGTITNSAFSDFTFNPIVAEPLPTENLLLSGKWKGREADLMWSTTREENSFLFSLERSTNGVDFEIVHQRPAAGFSPVYLQYPYLDSEVAGMEENTYFYRVMQEDLDGSVQYSNVVVLYRGDEHQGQNDIVLYPNPVGAGQLLNVRYHLAADERVTIGVYDILGKRIIEERTTGHVGQNEVSLTTKDLAVGTYVVKVQAGGKTFVKKVLVTR